MEMMHLLVDGTASNVALLRDGPALSDLVRRLVASLGMQIMAGPLQGEAVGFGPKAGWTVVAIISESHVAIHTWPEAEGLVNVDIFSCRQFDAGAVLAFLRVELHLARAHSKVMQRPLRSRP